ncbi:MAG: ABC transporter ATP-binding protein/permease [Oscillospiraceae bacterium]|nr:ABC transporter ATP-binding protein/permease [Oscillospiraceae bacterium]
MFHIFGNMKTKDRWLALLCLFLVCGQVYFDLRLPDYTAKITVLISSEVTELSQYFSAGGQMLACAVCSAILTVVVGYLAATIAADFSFDVRAKLFDKVTSMGSGEIKKFSTASLITRTTNDITQVQMIIAMGLQMMLRAPIMAIWAIIKILGKSWQLSAVVAAAVVIIVGAMITLLGIMIPKFRIVQKQIDDVNRITDENLSGIRVVRAFNAEEYQENKFETANNALMGTQLFTGRGMAFLAPIMMFVQSCVSVGIYYVGALLINAIKVPLSGTIAEIMTSVTARSEMLGEVVSFSSYALYVIMSFVMLLMIFMLLPRAQVSANRINEVIDCDIAVKEGKETESKESGSIEFKNVSFRYPDASEDCLKHISFTAEKGETVAFIGATGSGKSTLVGLAARLYDATDGTVMLDGKDISKYSFETLYEKIGYIPQKATLFADSVKGNITFGKSGHKMTDADVENALDTAQAAEFVHATEDGADSRISQSGSNVSGGQKQRLAIARAVARKPEILIFDDSFSALDYKTDRILRQRIKTDLAGTTCLIVAQRIGTIRHADRIVVLDNGAVAGIGTHDELMKNCSVYRQIALSQLSESELAANA